MLPLQRTRLARRTSSACRLVVAAQLSHLPHRGVQRSCFCADSSSRRNRAIFRRGVHLVLSRRRRQPDRASPATTHGLLSATKDYQVRGAATAAHPAHTRRTRPPSPLAAAAADAPSLCYRRHVRQVTRTSHRAPPRSAKWARRARCTRAAATTRRTVPRGARTRRTRGRRRLLVLYSCVVTRPQCFKSPTTVGRASRAASGVGVGGCVCVCTTPPGAPRVWSRIAGQCVVCQRYAGETTLPCEAAVRVGRTLVLVVIVCACVLRADGARVLRALTR